MNIGTLDIVPVRDAFPHEAHKFTVWLAENIDALAKQLNMTLRVLEREKAVGSFNVDLLCEDGSGAPVIIENQLEKSDHDHLGKLLTYLVNLEAKTAIWLTTEPRPEHQRVIDWLNGLAGAEFAFYLVRLQAVRIGDSPYAPLFTVLIAPDEQTREIGETKKVLAERSHQNLEFWTTLLNRSKGKTQLFSNVSPRRDHWLATGSGKSGIVFNYSIYTDGAGIDLSIDLGDYNRNKSLYDQLFDQKTDIESEFGEVLDWRRLEDNRVSRIVLPIQGYGGIKAVDEWPTIQDIMIDKMKRFDSVMRPRIAKLR